MIIFKYRAKVIFKILGDIYNNHRVSRKPMTVEDKEEFIKKSKEFSLYKVIDQYSYLFYYSDPSMEPKIFRGIQKKSNGRRNDESSMFFTSKSMFRSLRCFR